MSHWTHIVAAIDVDTYIESSTIKTEVEKMLKNAPRITGSERDAEVFVNVLSGYNHYTNADCTACKYGVTVCYLKKGGYTCEAPDGYVCPEGKYQTRVVITVIGDLRDRMREQTTEEWKAFKRYVGESINENGFYVRNCSCNILG